jgi:hypothetical protein
MATKEAFYQVGSRCGHANNSIGDSLKEISEKSYDQATDFSSAQTHINQLIGRLLCESGNGLYRKLR